MRQWSKYLSPPPKWGPCMSCRQGFLCRRKDKYSSWPEAVVEEKLLQPEVLGKPLCKPITNHFGFLVYLLPEQLPLCRSFSGSGSKLSLLYSKKQMGSLWNQVFFSFIALLFNLPSLTLIIPHTWRHPLNKLWRHTGYLSVQRGQTMISNLPSLVHYSNTNTYVLLSPEGFRLHTLPAETPTY